METQDLAPIPSREAVHPRLNVAEESSRWRRRIIAGGTALLALAVAVIGSVITGTNLGVLTAGVESLSAASSTFFGGIADLLPLGYAFGAGMVAAVNPCGFAMLPAYLGLYLGGNRPGSGSNFAERRLRQAYLVSIFVTAGFIILFGVVGLLIGAGARVLIGFFPWIGLAIGVLLAGVGAWVLGGGKLYTSLGDRLAANMGDISQTNSKGYFLFGLAYGTASLSCTLPIFLAVVGSTVAASGFLGAVSQFVLYGLGMGVVILLLTLSITLFEGAMLSTLRKALPYMQTAGALLLILAGAFIVYYWLTLGGLLAAFV